MPGVGSAAVLYPQPTPVPASRPLSEAVSVLRYATQPVAWIGDCGRAPGLWPASRGTRVGETRRHPQSQPRSLVDLRVTPGFSNLTAPFT